MARFEFSAPEQIIFGEGVLREVGPLAARFGSRVFLAAGHAGEDLARLINLLMNRV